MPCARHAARSACLLLAAALLCAACRRDIDSPSIQFTRVPIAALGGSEPIDSIAGRALGAKPGQQIVLYAYANTWYVQPTVANPITPIGDGGAWRNATHLGMYYAALLVQPGYRPALRLAALPPLGNGVVAIVTTPGRAHAFVAITTALARFRGYDSWWFRASVLLLAALSAATIYRLRVLHITRQLSARFEERLAERTRIAQELHDTLLQGFLSASMQVDVAEDQLPDDSPARPLLRRALQLMAQVTEEGRNVIRGLRVPGHDDSTIEEAFVRMGRDMVAGDRTQYRVLSHSNRRPLRPFIRDEVVRIGREALANAFQHAHAANVEVEIEYAATHFRLLLRDDGRGIDPALLQAGRPNHWGLPGMRQRAEAIGATLKLRSGPGAGTEVEISIPGPLAFHTPARPHSSPLRRWLTREIPQPPDNESGANKEA